MQIDDTKKNLTIRLSPMTRALLELIAEREFRSLANQMTVFLNKEIEEYMNSNKLRIAKSPVDDEFHLETISDEASNEPSSDTNDIPF